MVGVEFLVRLQHFRRLGGFPIVDSNVLGARIVENIHLHESKGGGFRHGTRVGVNALRKAGKGRFATAPFVMTSEAAVDAVDADFVARRATK